MLACALQLDAPREAQIVGSSVRALADGCGGVVVADDPRLAAPLPQPRVDVLTRGSSVTGFDAMLFAWKEGNSRAMQPRRRLAARLDAEAPQLGELVCDLDSTLVGKRPALADSIVADVGLEASSPAMPWHRSGAFDEVASGGSAGDAGGVAVELEAHSTLAELIEARRKRQPAVDREDADVMRRGRPRTGSGERFRPRQGARGRVRVSQRPRRARRAGWYRTPRRSRLEGPGKTVSAAPSPSASPGAIRHKVRDVGSGVIVAINRDQRSSRFAAISWASFVSATCDRRNDRASPRRQRGEAHRPIRRHSGQA